MSTTQLQQALGSMYSNALREDKMAATQFLERFQKSQEAWEAVPQILNESTDLQFQLFAAQTLRAKVTYDLNQLPVLNYSALKDALIDLVMRFHAPAQRLVRTQLCIALSQLLLQYLEWNGAVEEIIAKLAGSPCLLDFLRVLPEELSDVKKTLLTDAEFNERTGVLITDNVERVLTILKELAESSPTEALIAQVLDCLNNWIKECQVESILQINSLTTLIFHSLSSDDTFDRAIECLCTIIRETRDIENYDLIYALYEQLIGINKYLAENHPDKLLDPDTFHGLARMFVEAGEAWHVLVAKNPKHFMGLVHVLLDVVRYDDDLDIVKYTFYFWDLLKQLLTISKFEQSRAELADAYVELIRIIIGHLTYPIHSDDSAPLFDDKEQEEKFKDFRYEMGDVLKDCCAVVGATRALRIPFDQIQHVINNPTQSTWQQLEAPLFSMRTMAKEVSLRERTILPSIMRYLVQLPEHPKIRYAATLVLGRYSEWTFKNPEFLEPQMNYIIRGFEVVKEHTAEGAKPAPADLDIVMATSRALMYFCQDCSTLLVNYLEQLFMLYLGIRDLLDPESHFELVDGLAHVIAQVPYEEMYKMADMMIEPTIAAIAAAKDEETMVDQVEVLATFTRVLRCKDFEKPLHPVATLFAEKIWKVCVELLNKFGQSINVSERVCKLIKCGIQSYSTYLNDLLGDMATILHEGYRSYNYGCYLWVSGHLIREYGDEYTSEAIKESVYQFAMTQCATFFDKTINTPGSDIRQIPDVVGDFFRMLADLMIFYPLKFASDMALMESVLGVSVLTMKTVSETEPLMTCLHFLIDWVSWGLPVPPVALFDADPVPVQNAIKLFLAQGDHWTELMSQVLNGVIFNFPSDIQPDANDLMLKLLVVMSEQSESIIAGLRQIVAALPNVDQKEIDKLIGVVGTALPNKDNRRIRSGFKDFVNWYSRKNITPRSEFA